MNEATLQIAVVLPLTELPATTRQLTPHSGSNNRSALPGKKVEHMHVLTHFQLPITFDKLQELRKRDASETLPPNCLAQIVTQAADGVAITSIWTDEPGARAFYEVRAQATGMAFPPLVFTPVLTYLHQSSTTEQNG
ncbi:hypothetical protein ACFFLM_24755 [Deinococcus oregonensis]|uniref:ABM domain-containing protein n=1 Tax=Deinococcus oregonensis TaxID=1805970 RepID=A0ABV6B5Y1_9DEIO